MKIDNLLENITPSSAPNREGGQAPKFGRSDKFLEEKEQVDETTTGATGSGSVATVAQPTGSMQRRGKGSIFSGIKTSEKFPNSKSVKEARDMCNVCGQTPCNCTHINEGAYEDGVNDGMRGQMNRRASSIYGPSTSEYEKGYSVGIQKGKEQQQSQIAQAQQDAAPYEKMSDEELIQLRKDIQQRTQERHKIYRKLRGSDYSFDPKRHTPPNDKELKAQGATDNKAWHIINQVLSQRGVNINNLKEEGVAEGSLNEFAPDGFNGGDDDEGFSPEIAKMAQDDGFTKGAGLADGATLERAMAINYWHSQHGGMYKQYFAKGFKAGRMDKIRHNNKQYNLNLKLMKDGSIRHGQQGVAEGSTGVSVRKWANQVRKDHGADVKFWNRKEGGGAVDSVIARNSQGETVGVYNRKTGYPTVYEPKQGVAEGRYPTDDWELISDIESTTGKFLGSVLQHLNGTYGFYDVRKSNIESGFSSPEEARQAFVELHNARRRGVAEDQLDELKCWSGYTRVQGVPAGAPGSCKKKTSEDVTEEKCPQCGGPMFSEMIMNEKKDACYYKVKSRYKVWPSAYASGALVKCRKKGADSWGTGGKKNESVEEIEENLHKWFKEKWVRFGPDGKIRGDCARGDDSEGKPKCLPQSKAHSLGKKGRASAAARKRREDPNPERSGKAINVNTKKKSNEGVAEGSLNEFAPPGSGDGGDDGFSEETLKRLAAQWYNGDEDPRVERTLMAAGWEIGQDEGYDDEPGVFVVQSGDVNGNSYLSWPAHELKQGVAEGLDPDTKRLEQDVRDALENGDDDEDPLDNYPCYDCGSTIFLHHTKLCELAEPNAKHDLPSKPRSQHWTGEIPKGLHPIPGLEEGVAEGSLNEFALGDSGDDRTYEYEVYQCNPDDVFDWIGGPLYKTDRMDKAHSIAYELWKKHPDKAFMIWQERSQGSRGGYGIKDDEQGVAEGGDVPQWRVEQSDATGRYYVVTGYTSKSRRVWKSKQGAGDFNKRSDAEAKAHELNQGVAEVSDATLTSYLTKVDADSQKHEKDPTKRSPEKRNKSVTGFSRAFNKLDARKEKTDEVAPPGWEKTVKAMKKHKEIDNPWALAWSMKNKGYKSHKKEESMSESELTEEQLLAKKLQKELELFKKALDKEISKKPIDKAVQKKQVDEILGFQIGKRPNVVRGEGPPTMGAQAVKHAPKAEDEEYTRFNKQTGDTEFFVVHRVGSTYYVYKKNAPGKAGLDQLQPTGVEFKSPPESAHHWMTDHGFKWFNQEWWKA